MGKKKISQKINQNQEPWYFEPNFLVFIRTLRLAFERYSILKFDILEKWIIPIAINQLLYMTPPNLNPKIVQNSTEG